MSALLLAALLLLSSCAGGARDETTAAGTPQTAQTPAETETSEATPEYPDKKWDGYTFNILISGNTENNWKKDDFKADEQNGEVLNDARYLRNQAVGEQFGITVNTIEKYGSTKGQGDGYQLISKSVMAGDNAYDAAMICVYDAANLACSGNLRDLNSLPYTDLSKPWWDQKANADMTIKGRMFFTTGDISTADNDATGCYLFSKKLITDYALDDPYALVRDGKWTFDKMTSMASSVSADLNGDGKMDSSDRFGAIVWDDSIMGAVNGTLGKCAHINDSGELELTLYTERIFDMIDRYTSYIYTKDVCYNYQRVSYDITTPVSMFASGQSLFFMQLLDLTSYFRDMETDFGVLPAPKYDEAQEDYGHTIGSWHSLFLCVPAVIADEERTGAVLEALAYQGQQLVTPAYYEKTLKGKYFRDDESSEMLDIILSTRVYDLGWYFQIGLYNDEILYLVYNSDKDFASRYAKNESLAAEDIKRVNEAFTATMG